MTHHLLGLPERSPARNDTRRDRQGADPLKGRSRAYREQFWQYHVQMWRAGGKKQAAYCREQKLSVIQFGYWKRKLALGGATPAAEKAELVEWSAPITVPAPKTLTAVPAQPGPASLRVWVGGYPVDVGAGFCPWTLTELVQTLGRL